MASIDIFLLSSQWEGFGFVLTEAMIQEKPVIAFDITSNPEIIANNQTGYLVPFPDIDKFTNRVTQLCENKELRIQMGKKGRLRVIDNFLLEKSISHLKRHLLNSSSSISLIISTYNKPDFLSLVLKSVLEMSTLPDEVIIADDGSTIETKERLSAIQKSFPVPLIHCWHEDKGYRLSMIRNKAIAKASGELIIISDGDLLFSKHFIADYKKSIKSKEALIASRVFLTETHTRELLKKNSTKRNILGKGIFKNRLNGIRFPILKHLYSPIKDVRKKKGGLLGFWKKDLIDVNGFNEDFIGWGREDSDFIYRMNLNGVSIRKLKFCACTFHLHHPLICRKELSANEDLFRKTQEEKEMYCQNGIDKYLKS